MLHSEDEEEADWDANGVNAYETDESAVDNGQNSDGQSQFRQNIVENPDEKDYRGDEHKNQDWSSRLCVLQQQLHFNCWS